MEKMYEVLRFVEKGTECQPSIDCLQGELLIYYLRDNTQLDKAVLFEWFRQIAGEIRKYQQSRRGQNYRCLTPYSIVVTDMEQRYPEKYQYEKMSSTEFTGKDEILIAKQDTIIANGERYISELSSRQRVLAEMEEQTPVVETTTSSVISNTVKYAVVGCVGGIVVAIILGLVLDLLNKTLSDERELKNEYGVKCLAGSNILPKKKNRIDRWIESIRCTKTPLEPEKWAEYVATRISQENMDSRSVLLTGCGVNIVEEKKLLLLKDYLKKKNINLILANSVISDASALTQGENVKNVILAERVGVSEVVLINEEIEIIKGMDKNLVGFVLV